MITLRPYQHKADEAIAEGWNRYKRQLVVMPTGAGKTVLFAKAASREKGRTLVLVHRGELAHQAVDKIASATGINAGVEMAGQRAGNARVVVGGVQTFQRGLGRWPKDTFDLIICDEAHHSVSKGWQQVLNHFDSRVLGVTATPDRTDNRNLGSFYENVAYEVGLFDLVNAGYLAPISVKTVPVKLDISKVGTIAGDFADDQVALAMEPMIPKIAKSLVEETKFRKTLIFVPLIATSKRLVEECRKLGMDIHHIDGASDGRRSILDNFHNNRFDALCNAMLLTEGYDCRDINCVVILRPTKSRPLYAQMVGRGTRTCDGKSELLLLDYLWLHEKHHVCRPADLIAETEEEAEVVMDLINSRGEGDLQAAMEVTVAAREATLRKKLQELSTKKGKMLSAEEFAFMHNDPELAEYKPVMKWEHEPVTAEQAQLLKKIKVDAGSVLFRGQASAIINKHAEDKRTKPASSKQKFAMKRSGHPNWRNATAEEARAFFARRHYGS